MNGEQTEKVPKVFISYSPDTEVKSHTKPCSMICRRNGISFTLVRESQRDSNPSAQRLPRKHSGLPWETVPTNSSTLRESGAKATALQTLSRLPSVHKPREASGLRRVYRRSFPERGSVSRSTSLTRHVLEKSEHTYTGVAAAGHRPVLRSSVRSEIFVATHATKFPSPGGAAYSAPDGA
jgi:hypothetical protein